MNSIILLLAASGLFSSDKLLHFGYSAGMTGISNHIMVNQLGMDQDQSRYLSISLTTSFGIGKELMDLKEGKDFDFKDIIWDLVGIGVGYFLFVR